MSRRKVDRSFKQMAMDYCDLNCRHASWPKDPALDGSGSCRTFQAIYCEKKAPRP